MGKISHVHVLKDSMLSCHFSLKWPVDPTYSIEIPEGFFVETVKLILKCIWRSKRHQIEQFWKIRAKLND